MVDAFFFN